jgi:hypothetical protein
MEREMEAEMRRRQQHTQQINRSDGSLLKTDPACRYGTQIVYPGLKSETGKTPRRTPLIKTDNLLI